VDLGKQKRWELLLVFNAIFVMLVEEVFVILVNPLAVVLPSGDLFYKNEPLFLSLLKTMAAPFIGYAKSCEHTSFPIPY
jgi:hypothetical protein